MLKGKSECEERWSKKGKEKKERKKLDAIENKIRRKLGDSRKEKGDSERK